MTVTPREWCRKLVNRKSTIIVFQRAKTRNSMKYRTTCFDIALCLIILMSSYCHKKYLIKQFEGYRPYTQQFYYNNRISISKGHFYQNVYFLMVYKAFKWKNIVKYVVITILVTICYLRKTVLVYHYSTV